MRSRRLIKPSQVVLFTRPGCHLCQDMKKVLERVAPEFQVAIREVDISSDPELSATYGQEIPVLMIDGRRAFKYRLTEEELRKRLGRRI